MPLIEELKRRQVLPVFAAYAVVAWGAIEVSATVAPLLGMPEWVPRLVTILAIAGFPLVLVLAWFYDLSRHGIERTIPEKAPPAPTAGPSSTSITSLAVLPLEEVDAHAEDPLADGLTEALITDLARATGLRVISRSSVVRFKHSTESLQDIAQRLGVDALVMGSVRRSGTRIRISVELIDPTTERVLWADRHDRDMEDVLRVQDEIARAIADAVQARVLSAGTTPRQVVPEAYLFDLKGRRIMEARTEEGFLAALRCFEHALDIDPSYGTSYLGIARCHIMLANYGIASPAQTHRRAQVALERAQEFGADAADVLGERAWMHWQFEFDWNDADNEFRQALALAPNSAQHWYWYGLMLLVTGRSDAGLEALERSKEFDPLSALVEAVYGWALFFARRYDEAESCLREVLALHPDLAPAYWFLGMTLVEQGDSAGAIEAYQSAISRTGRISRLLGYLGHAYGRAGHAEEAKAILFELEQRGAHTYVPPYFPALVHAGLGQWDPALRHLEHAIEIRDCMVRDLLVDASWDALRDDVRFHHLIAAIHYPEPHATDDMPGRT